MKKGLRNRLEEDVICSQVILRAVVEAAGLQAPTDLVDLHPTMCIEEHTNRDATIFIDNSEVSRLNADVLSTDDGVEILNIQQSPKVDAFQSLLSGQSHKTFFVPRVEASASHPSIETDALSEQFVCVEDVTLPKGSLIYSGSFNPLHEGHVALVVAALRKQGWQPESRTMNPLVIFEIPFTNADKGGLSRDDLIRRLGQFDVRSNQLLRDARLTNVAACVTTKPLFVQKAEILQNGVFLLGADTFARIINPVYYLPKPQPVTNESSSGTIVSDTTATSVSTAHTSVTAHSTVSVLTEIRGLSHMTAALARMLGYGCSFIVGGRVSPSTGEFETMDDIWDRSGLRKSIPAEIVGMFEGIPESLFRVDLSSTDIRNRIKREQS